MAHEHFYVKRSERESLVQPELIYTGLLEDFRGEEIPFGAGRPGGGESGHPP